MVNHRSISNREKILKAILEIHSRSPKTNTSEICSLSGVSRCSVIRWTRNLLRLGEIPEDLEIEIPQRITAANRTRKLRSFFEIGIENKNRILRAAIKLYSESREMTLSAIASAASTSRRITGRWINRLRASGDIPEDLKIVHRPIAYPKRNGGTCRLTQTAISNRAKVLEAMLKIHGEGIEVTSYEVQKLSRLASSTIRLWMGNLKEEGILPPDMKFQREPRRSRKSDTYGLSYEAIRNLNAVKDAISMICTEGREISVGEVTEISGIPRKVALGWLKRLQEKGRLPYKIDLESNNQPEEMDCKVLEKRLDLLKKVTHSLGRRPTYEELRRVFPD